LRAAKKSISMIEIEHILLSLQCSGKRGPYLYKTKLNILMRLF
jgi:hypothetical protein